MSNESTEQGESGRRGAQASQTDGAGHQPRQGSGRTETDRAEQEPKHHFAPGQAPSEQGDQSTPSPETIREHQQGFAGSGSGHHGSRGAHDDRTEEIATSGEPRGEHVRHGRQGLPGDRPEDPVVPYDRRSHAADPAREESR